MQATNKTNKRHSQFLQLTNGIELAHFLNLSAGELLSMIEKPIYDTFKIKKKQGGYRVIQSPNTDLKNTQQQLNDLLQLLYYNVRPASVNGFVCSYGLLERSVGIYTNAEVHTNKGYVLNMDIKDFFPSISAKKIKCLFAGEFFKFNENMASLLTALCTFESALPVGSPASPVLSNFYCMQLDIKLKELADTFDLAYTRYADDLTFSGNKKFNDDFITEVKLQLSDFGFTWNRKKFRIKARHQRQTVTGLVVNKKVNVNRTYRKELRAIQHDIEKNGLSAAYQKHFNVSLVDKDMLIKFQKQIKGKLNFINSIKGASVA